MNRHFSPEDVEQWTHKLVAAAYVRALTVLRAVPARIGPAGDRSHWPEVFGDEGHENDEEPRFRPRRHEISQAEIALIGFVDQDGRKHPGWLNGALVGYPEQRKTFSRWALWASHGKRDFDGMPMTEEDFARRLHISESSLRRQREQAAGIIAVNLNQAGLKPWYVEKPARKNRARAQSSTVR